MDRWVAVDEEWDAYCRRVGSGVAFGRCMRCGGETTVLSVDTSEGEYLPVELCPKCLRESAAEVEQAAAARAAASVECKAFGRPLAPGEGLPIKAFERFDGSPAFLASDRYADGEVCGEEWTCGKPQKRKRLILGR